jgi:hypothetical protein
VKGRSSRLGRRKPNTEQNYSETVLNDEVITH